MFTGIDMFIITVITFLVTAFVCLFIAGSSKRNREEEAYDEGYAKGYEDGKKVNASNECIGEGRIVEQAYKRYQN